MCQVNAGYTDSLQKACEGMINDSQTYLCCATCGEFVNSSEEAAHKCVKKSKIETCAFIPITKLIPEDWAWFYEQLSETGSFTWGDNNRSMITADRLVEAIEELGLMEHTTPKRAKAFMNGLRNLGNTYIDLEN